MAAKSQVTPDMTQTCLAITNLYSQSQGFSAADRNGAQRPFTHSRLKGFFNATEVCQLKPEMALPLAWHWWIQGACKGLAK